MALELMADGTVINVTPENWNDLAYRERQIEEAKLGRKLTPAESISIIENYRRKGMNQPPIDDAKRIGQAANSATYEEQTRHLYGDDLVDGTAGVLRAAANLPNVIGPAAINVATIGGVALGLFVLWKVFK